MTPTHRALLPLTIPISWVYRAAVAVRNRRYDRGVGVERLDRPVISVGNLTVGGTGKTPMVMWIARRLLEAGHHPVIAMRGYGAHEPHESDEYQEYLEECRDARVVADPDRAGALRNLFQHGGSDELDVVILDDAFQHRRLHRDLNLVLVDASAARDQRVLPAGRLREPLRNLRRAHAVIVTRADSVDADLSAWIESFHGRPPLAWTRTEWTALDIHHRGDTREEPVQWLAGRHVATMLGVGNPRSVEHQIERSGATIRHRIAARDHQLYSAAFLRDAQIQSRHGIESLVVTRKDWVKLRLSPTIADWPVPIVVPRLRIEFLRGEEALRNGLDRCLATPLSRVPDKLVPRA